jgi:SOS-response transcriptional repressor LexA
MILTIRKRQILAFIAEYTSLRGYPPTIKEIGFATGLTSTSSTAAQLRALQEAGLLAYKPYSPRSIRLAPGVAVSPDGSISRLVPVDECQRCKTQHPADLDRCPVTPAAPDLRTAGSR